MVRFAASFKCYFLHFIGEFNRSTGHITVPTSNIISFENIMHFCVLKVLMKHFYKQRGNFPLSHNLASTVHDLFN